MIQISLYGRMDRDPEQRTTKNDTTMAFVSMAADVARHGADRDLEWFKLVAFGRQADALLRHKKGDLVGVMGTLTRERWTGDDGHERATSTVVVDAVMSARTVRPSGGRKRSGSGTGDSTHLADAGARGPLNDDLPF